MNESLEQDIPQDDQSFESAINDGTDTGSAPLGATRTPAELPDNKHRILKMDRFPEPPAPEAFAGLAGEIVRAVSPYTEADPTALLVHLLGYVGCAAGPDVYGQVGATKHPLREFFGVVGDSSKARKGEAANAVKSIFRVADREWVTVHMVSGVQTAEGLVYRVRDEVTTEDEDGNERVVDEGVKDKRLQVHEPELARILAQSNKQDSTLSHVIREAFDVGDLQTLSKFNPTYATEPHIAIIGHVTRKELQSKLTSTDMVNGFANRFVWVSVHRSKALANPEPFTGPVVNALGQRVREVLRFAKSAGRMERDAEANEFWTQIYTRLSGFDSDDADETIADVLLARAEVHVLRLSMVYALMDRSKVVQVKHLKSALALWQYSERSVIYIFQDSIKDPVAEKIRAALEGKELTRTEIRDLFAKHKSAERIDRALQLLVSQGIARCDRRSTGGRPQEVWSHV